MSAHDPVRLARLVAAFGCTAILTCTAAGQQTSEVSGCVTDDSAVAIANATVVIAGTLHGVRTDADGCYRFERVVSGRYLMRVHHEGFVVSETPLVAADGEPVRVDVVLRPLVSALYPDPVRGERTAPGGRESVLDRLSLRFSYGYLPGGYRAVAAQAVPAAGTRYSAVFPGGPGHDVFARFANVGSVRVGEMEVGDQSALSFDTSPYLEAGIASNTEGRYLDAGITSAPRQAQYAVRFLATGAGSYADGAGSTVTSSWSGGIVSARARHVVGRTSIDVDADALVGGARSHPTSRVDEKSTTAGSAGLTVRRRAGEGNRTTYTLDARRSTLDATLDVESWPFDEPVGTRRGERNVSSSHAVLEVLHAASDRLKLTAGVRLQSDALDGLPSPNAADADPWPDVRDRTASLDVGTAWSTSFMSIEGSISVSQARSRFTSLQGISSTDNTVLPSGDLVIRFDRASASLMYRVMHTRALADPQTRHGSSSYFQIGQTEVIADGNPGADESVSTTHEFSLVVPRASLTLEVGTSFEFLHEFPFVEFDATGDPTRPWRVAAGRGWIASGAIGLEYAPVELARVGVVTRVTRARNEAADEPLARIPSSIVGGYIELGSRGGHPYVRWATLGRLARDRVAESVGERKTSRSLVSDVEVGHRFRRFRLVVGVRNVGDRLVRDHIDGRTENLAPMNAPGRQFTVRVRYLVD